MTEVYRVLENCPFLGRYSQRTNPGPLSLSNLCPRTPIRQLRQSRGPINLTTEAEAKAEARSKTKSEASTEPKAEDKAEPN